MHSHLLGLILLGAPQLSLSVTPSSQFCGTPDRRTQVCVDSIDREGDQMVRIFKVRDQSIQEFEVSCHLKLILDAEVIAASVNTCTGQYEILKRRQLIRQAFKMIIYKSDYSSSGNRTWVSVDGIRHGRAFQLLLE